MHISDFLPAGVNLWRTAGLGAIFGWLLVLFDPFIDDMFGFAVEPRLVIDALEYRNGLICQAVGVSSGDPTHGTWSASIFSEDGEDFICGGGGNGTYTRTYRCFTPDDWVGDECNLTDGETYTALGSWILYPDNGRNLSGFQEFLFRKTNEIAD